MKQTAGIIFRSMILVLCGVAIGLLINRRSAALPPEDLTAYSPNSNKLDKVMQIVRKKYVDSIDVDSVEGVTINNMLQKLDPHSVYLHQKQAQSLSEKLEGGFDGIGIESQLLRDTLFVTQVLPNSPAAKAGLPNGARVVTLNGKPFSGTHLTNDKVNDAFSGRSNTGVEVGILNPDKTIKTYRVKRSRVSLSSLDAAYITAPGTGYIKISKFGSATDVDFQSALKRLKGKGMQKLVLDLRGNGGGYLNTATTLADEFLPKNKLIVYTQGQHEPRTDYFASDSGEFEQGKLAVLIDEHSASASEILAGALQDLDRAIIVGRRSFGKGLVQEQFTFEDGTALNLTVARYFTPSGRSIQKSYKNGVDSYRNDLADRLQKGELYSAQNDLEDTTANTGVTYHTTAGKKVYGGGGITPDVFVPEDAAENSRFILSLVRNQIFSGYVVDNMQNILKNYRTPDDFMRFYSVNDIEFNRFINYANNSEFIKEIDVRDVTANKAYVKTFMKAQAARFKWGNEWFYRIMNQNDAGVTKAVAALN
ncbi:S41 family peptidase [Mucilaginibacter terrae]|uniref:Carboxyl-terminal processing protease n=1 Tax=Mucilaginibacter terrae TaxID=1955052 RepID=A0ABU3GVL1_9SPHI|nr:S41 family peptidase [Mucilaginibacter terrae]MDT3403818.1 carboxyl-terminal processing protease [Mucilaginibacter terrae]